MALGPLLVLALLLSAVAVSQLANADDDPPALLATDPAAPGMVRVWIDPDRPLDHGQSYRVRWWSVDADERGALVGSVVLTAFREDGQGPVAITGLTAGTYDVELDVVVPDGGGFVRAPGTDVDSGRILVEVAALPADCGTTVPPATDEDPDPDPVGVSVCVRFVDGADNPVSAPLFIDFFSGSTSTSGFTLLDGRVGLIDRAAVDFWPSDTADDPTLGVPEWSRFRMAASDRSATYAVDWWSAFGDAGVTGETATEFLVPNGGAVNLGDVTLVPGTRMVGEIMKSDDDGGALPLEPADIVSPCTLILRVDSGSTEYVNEICGFDGNPALGEGQGGKWQVALLPGEYVVRIFDRANYFGGEDILNYNVRFASEWWRSDGGRGENQAQASVITVGTDEVDLGQRVLRNAEQLRIDITGIPQQIFDDNPLIERPEAEPLESINARISVTDDFGNWFGGAMEIDRSARTAKASVTGLVEDRPYRVFVSFNGVGVNRFWLVGGGTLTDATPVVPQGGETAIEESWQLPQIIVSLHREDGTPYGPGEACVFLRSVDDEAPRRSASACTGQLQGFDGVILLQRVPEGIYEAVAYRRSGNNSIGPPVIIRNFELDDEAETIDLGTEFTTGLSDVSGLTAPSLPFPYSPDRAIVIPVEGN